MVLIFKQNLRFLGLLLVKLNSCVFELNKVNRTNNRSESRPNQVRKVSFNGSLIPTNRRLNTHLTASLRFI